MPRTCTICSSIYLSKVNAALIEGVSIREVAKRYSISAPAVARHKLNCVARDLAKKYAMQAITAGIDATVIGETAPEAVLPLRLTSSPDAYSELASLKSILSTILNEAVSIRDSDLVVAASRELRATTETMLKVWETQKRIEAQYEKATPLSATWVYGWLKQEHPEIAHDLAAALKQESHPQYA